MTELYLNPSDNTTPDILPEVDFQLHKLQQIPVIEKYQYISKRKTQAMIDCGHRLVFGRYQNAVTLDEKMKLEKMYTCKDRFCPFCNWRRARKLAIQTYEVLEAIQATKPIRYIFLTLTVKNCPIEDLKPTIQKMQRAFNAMARYKRFRGSVLGYMRALEIFGDDTPMGEAHPHFHCLLAVPSTYFDPRYNLYIKQAEWQAMWRKAMKLDYNPSVDVRVIYSKKTDGDPIAKAVAEAVKYPLKGVNVARLSLDDFSLLVMSMRNVRAIAFGGLLKEYRKRLNLDDVEDGDLVYEGEEREALWVKVAEVLYEFGSGRYGLNYYLQSQTPASSDTSE